MSFTILRSLLKLTSIESVIPSNHLILCLPLLLLPSIFPSISLFQLVSSLQQVAKLSELRLQYQSFQWIFRVDFLLDWLDWSPYCQRTLRSLLQHHNSKVSILQHPAFLMVQSSLAFALKWEMCNSSFHLNTLVAIVGWLINWPNFSIVVSRGTGNPKERRRAARIAGQKQMLIR